MIEVFTIRCTPEARLAYKKVFTNLIFYNLADSALVLLQFGRGYSLFVRFYLSFLYDYR
jgi:hypothetical protein